LRRSWWEQEVSHILLVPIVAVWLAWVRRRRLQRMRPRRLWLGPAAAAVAAGLLLWGPRFEIVSFMYLGAALLLAGAVLSVAGWTLLRDFGPVFGLMLFLVPVPGRVRSWIGEPVEQLTVNLVVGIQTLLGEEVRVVEQVLLVGGQAVPVDAAFAGLPMVLALVLVAYAFAFSTPLRGYARVVLLLVSPLLAIGCNAVRLAMTLWVVSHAPGTASQLLLGLGAWVMLLAALMLLLSVLRLMEWLELPVTALSRVGR
jgi:exosortase